MLRAENLIWIGEPSQPYDNKYHCWPRWVTWPYKMRFDGVDCNIQFSMDNSNHDVYLAEVVVIKVIDDLKLSPDQRRFLLDVVERYGDSRDEQGRSDVKNDWAESDAGAGL